jgi:hypothetical protein
LAIMGAARAGNALTLAAINTLLVAAAGAGTELTTAGGSESFGTVRDILRILAGEIYRLPLLTILCTQAAGANAFLPLAGRQAIVTAQLVTDVTTYGQFYASGSFLAATDNGYRARPTLVPTGAFNCSNASGVVFGYKQATFQLLNSHNFAYDAASVTAWRLRAVDIAGTNIPATGISPAIGVYDQDGNAL